MYDPISIPRGDSVNPFMLQFMGWVVYTMCLMLLLFAPLFLLLRDYNNGEFF